MTYHSPYPSTDPAILRAHKRLTKLRGYYVFPTNSEVAIYGKVSPMIALAIIAIVLSGASGFVWYLTPSHVKIIPCMETLAFVMLTILFYYLSRK